MVFGMGDYSCQSGHGLQGHVRARTTDTRATSSTLPSSGSPWPRAPEGIDAIDGPFGNIGNTDAYRESCLQARALGMVGKWALHPKQIEHAQDIFTPDQDLIEEARKMTDAYRASEARGEGAVMIDGKFADAATVRLYANSLDLAELYGL